MKSFALLIVRNESTAVPIVSHRWTCCWPEPINGKRIWHDYSSYFVYAILLHASVNCHTMSWTWLHPHFTSRNSVPDMYRGYGIWLRDGRGCNVKIGNWWRTFCPSAFIPNPFWVVHWSYVWRTFYWWCMWWNGLCECWVSSALGNPYRNRFSPFPSRMSQIDVSRVDVPWR